MGLEMIRTIDTIDNAGLDDIQKIKRDENQEAISLCW